LFERSFAEDFRVLVQQPLIVDKFNEPQPDVVVLREPLGLRKPRAEDCLVVIEVSDTTYDDDRKIKLPAYLAGGVPLVWIVNLRAGRAGGVPRVGQQRLPPRRPAARRRGRQRGPRLAAC
jgi:Uma2 family endonuclease